MKTLITLFCTLALAGTALGQALNSKITSAEPKAVEFKVVTLADDTPVAGSATNLQFTSATFYGYKGVSATYAPTNNTSTAYLGYADATGVTGVTNATPAFVSAIAAGSSVTLGQTGAKYDLKDIYFLGATGDKIVIAITR